MLCRLLDYHTDLQQACHQRRDDHKVQAIDLDFDLAHRDNFRVHGIQAATTSVVATITTTYVGK